MELESETSSLKNKWVSTVASVWIQCTSGSLYTFSIYSQTLKSTQGYDQSTLDIVSVFKDIGVNCGVLAGFLYYFATAHGGRPGPWIVHFAGAIQCFLGYFFIWAAVYGVLPRPPVPVMCLFMLVAAHAQSFFNTANVVTGVRNFPRYSGTIVGIMKGFLGLSGAILIQTYETIFNGQPTSFLLMLALLPTLNSLLCMWFVRIHHVDDGIEKEHLNTLSIITLVVATYLMIKIVLEHIFTFQFPLHVATFILLLMLLASPLYIAIRAQPRESRRILHPSFTESDQLIGRHNQETSDFDHERGRESEESLTLFQALYTIDFWILFFATACGMGTGLATVNNISQIGLSLGYTSSEINTLVSLWSIWNFFGRFGAGYVSDYYLHAKGWARPLFMFITLMTMSIGHVVIASGLPGALFAGSIVVGVCYGSQWSLMPTITSEIFGVVHMGTIFNAITVASPVGSYLFSVRVVGYIYDKEASSEGDTCIGTYCFMLSFFIMAFATLLGSLAALGLFFWRRSFYDQVVVRRLQHPSNG
ncbi:protein NUCLEAR FUSION DEFECTIVE 4 [Cucumis sativus]|uniref:Uncharacterized protein n=1 Tax=Cucumis sativus TaxID=3659 RepID=A0A0A0LPA7_CUCSA|nr:protein NUCLEAR FUSION DEFECTIVE 4 [Cucumis sativus]XP_031740770.1 protein NUCLEAR FUSION DEFECTIVE 4 [Cucumis sativus]XP_031740779.1 protein NUCLEAR FUSION DEFECTIVE 4 [Cucumis sativus]XP_031740781.1 protein NUCLEAR FUSION DEFECTIVE 4 [Cucumis sativus]KGN63638.1 hypothetical protein Csa_013402 [Cucumis sativus]